MINADSKNKSKIVILTESAVLTAIIVIMSFTPLGYIKTPFAEISFIMIPVAVGAIHLGPYIGAYLGFVFGLTSFIQCFGISVFGTLLFGINPFYCVLLCFVPRVLMGFLVGVIFRLISKIDKTRIVSFAVSSLSGALLNTAIFVAGFVLLYSRYTNELGSSALTLASTMLSLNALIEAGVCCVVGGAISIALNKYIRYSGAHR